MWLVAFGSGLIIGLFIGVVVTVVMIMKEEQGKPKPRHSFRRTYPRKTTMPKLVSRVPGRPTNINEPPASIRPAQFRFRRQMKD
jgi:hypothetical protein